jgi:hypothetical protein
MLRYQIKTVACLVALAVPVSTVAQDRGEQSNGLRSYVNSRSRMMSFTPSDSGQPDHAAAHR